MTPRQKSPITYVETNEQKREEEGNPGRNMRYRAVEVGSAMSRFNRVTLTILILNLIALCACQNLVPRDVPSMFDPHIKRSEIVGLLAGFGTTFAAVPDLLAMLKRRSSAGMNPRMAAIMGVFQILWVYYGLLILSRPVVIWNVIAVLTNFLSVGAYRYFVREEKRQGVHQI
jgi:MtN3 and saliva related transmembrane protein